jgi:signal peptidase II
MLQILIIVAAVAADQLSKFLLVPMLLQLPKPYSMPVIPGVFSLTYVGNEGASFGMLQGNQAFFIIVTIIVLIVGAFLMVKTRNRQSLFLKISLSLVIGGAIGNFIDRVFIGYVRDMFDFSQVYFPWVFNVADMCLVIGAILLGVYVIFIYRPKANKDDKGGDETPSVEDEQKEL